MLEAARDFCPDVILSIASAITGSSCGSFPALSAMDASRRLMATISGVTESLFPACPILKIVKKAGVPCALSYSAGAYVCNDLFYTLLQELCGNTNLSGFHNSISPLNILIKAEMQYTFIFLSAFNNKRFPEFFPVGRFRNLCLHAHAQR